MSKIIAIKTPVGQRKWAKVNTIPIINASIQQNFTSSLREQLEPTGIGFLDTHTNHIGKREFKFR